MKYPEVFTGFVTNTLKEDNKALFFTPAMLVGSGLAKAVSEYPGRIFDMGITEPSAIIASAATAVLGLHPVVTVYSTFLQRAFSNIIVDVCLQDFPLLLAVDRGGIVGDDGVTHQGFCDLSYLSLIPNLVVSAPKDGREFYNLLYTGLKYDHPFSVRFPRGDIPDEYGESHIPHIIPIGKSEILKEGKDIALIAIGNMVYPVIEAADELGKQGIEALVINARFVKPIDSDLVVKASQCKYGIVTIEENTVIGGFGAAVSNKLQELRLNPPIKYLGLPDMFIEHGSQKELRHLCKLDVEGLVEEIIMLTYRPEHQE